MALNDEQQAAIAFDALLNFVVKTELFSRARPHVRALVVECLDGIERDGTSPEEVAVYRAAIKWLDHCDARRQG